MDALLGHYASLLPIDFPRLCHCVRRIMTPKAKIAKTKADFEALPEGCIARILSFTSPLDACRLSLVSKTFGSAADSDTLWERFLPTDYKSLIPTSNDSSSSKKQLFCTLCRPILIDDAKKSIWLDKGSGKKCYMLAARDITIIWGSTPQYWVWKTLRKSRFPEVAELQCVWWFEVHGKINTSMLSLAAGYVAYLVFKLRNNSFGFESYPVEVSVGIAGSDCNTSTALLAPVRESISWRRSRSSRWQMEGLPLAEKRADGWLEMKLGEYFNETGEDGELEMSIMEVKTGLPKGGLVVQGIEIRLKEN